VVVTAGERGLIPPYLSNPPLSSHTYAAPNGREPGHPDALGQGRAGVRRGHHAGAPRVSQADQCNVPLDACSRGLAVSQADRMSPWMPCRGFGCLNTTLSPCHAMARRVVLRSDRWVPGQTYEDEMEFAACPETRIHGFKVRPSVRPSVRRPGSINCVWCGEVHSAWVDHVCVVASRPFVRRFTHIH
jgi:hypothetical protein